MRGHTAEWWAARVDELATVGDARVVAKRHGVKARTLIWWRSELRKRGRKEARPRLLPVVVAAETSAASSGRDEIEVFVELGSTRVTVRGAITAEHLAAIVRASPRSC